MTIGLLSDTHGWLDPAIKGYFEACDEIWHAGDIGPGVAEQLEEWKPFRAVYGNIDNSEIRHRYPEDMRVEIGGMEILMTHIAGTPPHYQPRVRKMLDSYSHITRVSRDEKREGLVYLNPGAAGLQGFHRVRTVMRVEIQNGKIGKLEVIELGARATGKV
jgi:uncharacterized protein